MRIKKRLQINVAVSVMIAVAIGLVLFLAFYRLNMASITGKIAGDLMISVLERVTLRNDYIRNNSARAKEQWFAKNEQIGRLLKSARGDFRDSEDRKIIAEVIEHDESFGRIFSAIVANRAKDDLPPDAADLAPEIEERLLNQLNMRVYEIVIHGRELWVSSEEAHASALRLAVGGVISALLILIVATTLIAEKMSRAIMERIDRLRDGASVIGGGDLKHRIDVEGDDEFVELSEAFNAMAAKLSGSYQNLENEIGVRQRAEAALKKLNEKLELRVAQRTENLRISLESLEKEIDNRKRAENALKELNETLEERIVERTAQLTAANEALQLEIVERKRAKEKLQKSEEQLRAMNDELEQRVERRTLELQETQIQYLHAEKLSAIGKLSASIAHEFNSPLQGIMAILKGLKKRATMEDEDRELLEAAIVESERVKNLIRSLHDFNRPSSDRKMVMDVHKSIDSLLLLCKSDFKNKRISVVLNYTERLPQILAVPDQIKQVFLNLLSNAADACLLTGGVITISTWQEEKSVAVAIKDTGIGIPSEKMDQIFQPFYTTKPAVKGTGLGLSICHGIVKKHQGEIRVSSRPGEGATFTILLPIEGAEDVNGPA